MLGLMKPDHDRPGSGGADQRVDRVERAHLRDPADRSHVIHRYPPSPDLASLVQRFWIPVWSVPPGAEAPQRVLQYPVALMVITDEYARFYGVTSGLSTTTLVGDGWGVGLMFQPAAGSLLTGGSMAAWTDRFAPVEDVLGDDGASLAAAVRGAMAADPSSVHAHRAAMDAYEERLRPRLPVDDEGIVVNALVAFVEGRSDVVRVAQVCEEFDLTERALQRLVRRRIGITPKWLIQRRRLHEAAERLRVGAGNLAAVAADLGYADQPHFTRDFQTVTGMTPGAFAARFSAD